MSKHPCVCHKHHAITWLWKGMNELEKNEKKEEQILKAKCQHFRKGDGETRVCLGRGSWFLAVRTRTSRGRHQNDKQGLVHKLCELRLMGTVNTQCGHLLQVYPADVGQSGLAGTAWFYQVLRVHHHRPHAAHQLGFFMLHRQGYQGAHSFGQVSLPGPGTKQAMLQSGGKRDGRLPSTQLISHLTLLP